MQKRLNKIMLLVLMVFGVFSLYANKKKIDAECLSIAKYYVFTNNLKAVDQLGKCEESPVKHELLLIYYYNNKEFFKAVDSSRNYNKYVLANKIKSSYHILMITLKSYIAVNNDKAAYTLYEEIKEKWPKSPEYELTYATYLLSYKSFGKFDKDTCPWIKTILKSAKKKDSTLIVPNKFKTLCGKW